MEMAATTVQPCPSSFIFFTQRQKTRLHNIIHLPFLPLPPSHLRRRFSSSAARDSNSRKRRRKWDSNAETIRAKDFTFNTQNNEDEDDEEEEDYDGETASSGILEEAIDSIWILKPFKSFGWGLPPILLSLLFANGPKAFLMALALTIGQSAIAFSFEKVSGKSQSKQKRKTRARKTKKYTSRRTVRNIKKEEQVHEGPKNKKGMKGYQSWVIDDQGTTSFGGWDELDGTEPTRTPSTMENGSKRTTKPKDRLSMNETESNEPLLLRLLIAVFPFLGSWTKLFW
ncbi:hypothetical protein E1A91_A09G251500v1 [Gossypium mustelinum]|uniref:Uncharacterized protein n=1 Tax=Gossypium mustelinum TaxID=34275 RepID=A0A5D2Y2A8_GOSMU|nr:hypothetical protein E1A91_A09G251500v1 [Gossypium mustelinum]